MTLTCTNVTLRQKPLRNDRISLYLDYYPAIRNPYTMKMSRREFLGIYIYAKPKNEQQRMFNQDMLNKAEAIRCIRVQSLINEEFGFLDKNKQKVDFLAYFRTKAREKYEKWDCVYNHFEICRRQMHIRRRYRRTLREVQGLSAQMQTNQSSQCLNLTQFGSRLLFYIPSTIENSL